MGAAIFTKNIKFPNHLLNMPPEISTSSFIILLFSSGFLQPVCGSLIESAALGNQTDQQALLAFKDGLNSDPHGALRSWNQSIHFCHWTGVTCGRRHQRVVVLILDSLELRGPISPHLGNLSFLRVLALGNNNLEQRIPKELGRLGRLQILSLFNNSLAGEVPVNISGCSNLVQLELGRNNLVGKIPAEFGNSLSKLKEFRVRFNHLAGNIPISFANLSSLRFFYSSVNSIQGSIPAQFGRLKNLEVFQVASNKLVGMIPPSLFNISSIKEFTLQDNQFRGSLPLQLGGDIFPNLEHIDLAINLFDGTIPASISNASNLGYLDFAMNKFTGQVPLMEKLANLYWINLGRNFLGSVGRVDDLGFISSLTNITLVSIDLSSNNFGGELPHSVSNFSRKDLYQLYINNNEISGSIPDGIGNLVSLQRLYMGNNRLTGNIPSTIGKLTQLRVINLGKNGFNGTIPPSFGNLSLLMKLRLFENSLHGTIPSSLGKCKNLVELSLFINNLQGTIPREILSITSLYNLYLHQNRITGSLPTEIGSLINLEELRISHNFLSGKVPTSLGSCVRLRFLDMGTNNFEGFLPSSLSSLRGLEVIDLSRNNFSGNVPDYLASFIFLQYLNISFNDFKGEVPERGIFTNTTAIDVEGNMKLCGGVPQLHLPHCDFKTSKKLKAKLIILIALGATGVVLVLCFLLLCILMKPTKVQSLLHPRNSFSKFSYQTLREATDGFSEVNLIGVGSFGTVYKGLLGQSQQLVAVKVLNLQHGGASKSFMTECETLGRIRHRNLLKIVTACSSIDHRGNEFKALVYEFMPNGSLDDWLYSQKSQDEIGSEFRFLNLSQRLDIAIDVASALEYLHHHCVPPIIHCDLKPSNILLDDDKVGHVGDFGLAKFLERGINQSSQSQSSTIGLRDSIGYVAPEYGIGNDASASGDVYSYGILLLEMFTGKRPIDHQMFNGCLNLHDYVKMALPSQAENVYDSRLLTRPTREEDGSTRKGKNQNYEIEDCLISVLKVGIACSRELPRDRMTISEAISQLHGIKKELLGVGRAKVGLRS